MIAEPDNAAFVVGPVICWNEVAASVRVLAATSAAAGLLPVKRVAMTLTEPLRRLDEVAVLTRRAIAGDCWAEAELDRALASINSLAPESCGLTRRFLAEGDRLARKHRCGCGDPDGSAGRDAAAPKPARVGKTRDGEAEPAPATALDESGLVTLALALAGLRSADPARLDEALDALTALTAAAMPVEALVRANAAGGPEPMLREMERLAAAGFFGEARTMHASSGAGGDGEAMPDFPDIPVPRRPEDLLPGLRPLDELLAWLKDFKRWDPDWLDGRVFEWQPPFRYFPPGWETFHACLREAMRQIAARAAILPPPRPVPIDLGQPVPLAWVGGIRSITASGACAGDRIVIHGTGFAAIRDSAVLLLPSADGCRPVAVPASDWTDTAITVTLPAWISSGPVGFADKAYVIAYDAWAAGQNRLAIEILRLPCGRLVGPFRFVRPFRECPPDMEFNHLRAGLPKIISFKAGGLTAAVAEPGDRVLLSWSVVNAEHVRIDRISAFGPPPGFFGPLIDPPFTSRLIGPFSHVSPVQCVYRLTATGPCGTVTRDVSVAASKRPRLTIGRIEVTQSIQRLIPTVRLVERKPTVVRVTVHHGLAGFGSNSVPNVRGRIRVRRNDGVFSPWFDAANGTMPMAPNPGASITVVANPQRNNTNDTLNFLIPPSWCVSWLGYEVEVRTTGFGAVGGFAGFEGVAVRQGGIRQFEPRRTLQLRYIRVNWGGSTPSAAVCRQTLASAVPLLPTPSATIAPLAVGIQNPGGTADSDRDDLLDDFDDRHNCSTWEALTEWLGSDCPDDDGTIWVLIPGVFHRGRAYDIPSNVCFTPPGNGPYAAHELAHCLDQVHLGVMCANGQQAQGGDAASDWPNNGQLVDVPFDTTRNVALSLAGTGVFDVMTYCGTPNNTWPMPERWDRLWNRIGS